MLVDPQNNHTQDFIDILSNSTVGDTEIKNKFSQETPVGGSMANRRLGLSPAALNNTGRV